MDSPTRRTFVRATAAAVLLPRLAAQSAEARIDVLLNEPVGTIAPEIYGHFVEHLGGVVYDGIWVGEKSPVPNVNGLRKSLVDALQRVKPGMIRWPGGCFADQYDWRDGIGPRDQRPVRTNFWVDAPEWPKDASRTGPQRYDPNAFGTVEFARFCQLTGAQPYFAANLRSLPAQEFWRWVEYCNSPAGSTTLAQRRAADGSRDPLGVRYWGVGNESWGCGGNFDPEDYGSEFNRYTAWVPSYGVRLGLIGSGPNDGNVDWTRRFFSKLQKAGTLNRLSGWAMHHYAWNASGGRTRDWYTGKRDAIKFDAEQYYDILREADEMESLIAAHWAVMAEADPRHRTKLVVDEWGSWYASGTEPFAEALIGQQNTLRDAVLAGLTLDTFNRHADKVSMASIAQLVNCLQSLFLAHEDKFCVTPTYHVFDMYAAHQGGKSVRTVFAAPATTYNRNGTPTTMRGLNGSASLNGSVLTLTVTNPSMDQAREAEIATRGGAPKSVTGIQLAATDPRAHNRFEEPRAVEPKPVTIALKGPGIVHRFPPASVTKLTITL
ncbi:MAG TPA: alpha-L-arabinofuranosidase C-terminal domain-containing protein [Candidatus Acidoferrum sp.]|nr:alpha-L-arabinofuranosidase C-terminal domain-containing protein [Candidatus Acidoferrum sp.]